MAKGKVENSEIKNDETISFLDLVIKADAAFDETIEYIEYRRQYNSNLCTRWPTLNHNLMGGLAPNTILTIGGMSGCGKTSFVSMIEQDLFNRELNGHHNVTVLNFSLEMLIRTQITRKISSILHVSTRNILSVDGKISDELLAKCRAQRDIFSNMDLYYFDGYADTETIYNMSKEFIEKNIDRWVVIVLDHTLLVEGPGEMQTIKNLQKIWNELKRLGRVTIIQVTQLNRSIEGNDRKLKFNLHYPQKGDFSTTDAMFQISDYVICIHRPEMLGLNRYGPKRYDCYKKVYAHVLKNREGELSMVAFKEEFFRNDLVEMTEEELIESESDVSTETSEK